MWQKEERSRGSRQARWPGCRACWLQPSLTCDLHGLAFSSLGSSKNRARGEFGAGTSVRGGSREGATGGWAGPQPRRPLHPSLAGVGLGGPWP